MAKFCPNCGIPISAETLKFCPECGTPLTQSAENASVTPQQKPSTPKLNMMKKVYKCPDCGSYYDVDNAPNNCRGCGCFRGLFSLVDVDASFSIDEERKKEEKKIEKKKLAGFLIVMILLFSIPIFYGVSTRDIRPSSYTENLSPEIEQEELASNENDTETEPSSNSENEEYQNDDSYFESKPFRDFSDALLSLIENTFVSEDGTVTVTFRWDGMYLNLGQVTGPIDVESIRDDMAIVSCHSPLNGFTYRFVYVRDFSITEATTKETYKAEPKRKLRVKKNK